MESNPLGDVRAKQVEVIIVGAPLPPGRAAEVLRRTDLVFQYLAYEPVGPYGHAVRTQMGFPRQAERVPGLAPTQEGAEAKRKVKASISRWRADWGSVDLEWLFNHQVLGGRGWVHADGTIAMADELEDYPSGDELLSDCQSLAEAFPDLRLDVGVWGHGEAVLGSPMVDAPPTPWPSDLSARVGPPTVGFLIEAGSVEVVEGTSPRLFQRFGSKCALAVERALTDVRRCRGGANLASIYGEPGVGYGVSDAVVEAWREVAQSLGLVGPDPPFPDAP